MKYIDYLMYYRGADFAKMIVEIAASTARRNYSKSCPYVEKAERQCYQMISLYWRPKILFSSKALEQLGYRVEDIPAFKKCLWRAWLENKNKYKKKRYPNWDWEGLYLDACEFFARRHTDKGFSDRSIDVNLTYFLYKYPYYFHTVERCCPEYLDNLSKKPDYINYKHNLIEKLKEYNMRHDNEDNKDE